MTSSLSMKDSVAPPLEPESFVCMGDESEFVIRDHWGEVLLRVSPDQVRWTHGSERDGYDSGWLATLSEAEVKSALSPKAVMGDGAGRWMYWVEPLRAQCEHYKRVMVDFEGSDTAKRVERVCAAQRTEGGEFVALSDTRVYACEHREPRDFVSERRLRKFDADRVQEAKKSEVFVDGEAALEQMLRAAEEEEKNNG